MSARLRKGVLIPRYDGKRIEEWVGRVSTGTSSVSVARMLAPPGWVEPPQTPEFDEVMLVLKGELTLEIAKKRERVGPGELGLVRQGQTVVVSNRSRSACDYYSICAPAFELALAHFAPLPASTANSVQLDVRNNKGTAHAKRLQKEALRYLTQLELEGCELSIALVGDAAIRRLNRDWRSKDTATDVLSFPAGEMPVGTPGPRQLGDVIVSMDTAARQAKEYRRTLGQELSRYLVHGILHLLGHDHQKPAQTRKMAALEERLLGRDGMLDPRLPGEH